MLKSNNFLVHLWHSLSKGSKYFIIMHFSFPTLVIFLEFQPLARNCCDFDGRSLGSTHFARVFNNIEFQLIVVLTMTAPSKLFNPRVRSISGGMTFPNNVMSSTKRLHAPTKLLSTICFFCCMDREHVIQHFDYGQQRIYLSRGFLMTHFWSSHIHCC